MTKLRLGAIADEKPVKLTVEVPGALSRELGDYARVHAKLTGLETPLPPERLIPAMIERFISTDRAFARLRKQ